MTNLDTCAELSSALDRASLPDGDTDAAREAVAASMRTLPDRASEDLKDIMPTIVKMVTVMQGDAQNDTHELDTFLSDPAVSAEYDKAQEVISMLCLPETTEEEVTEEEIVQEGAVDPESAQ